MNSERPTPKDRYSRRLRVRLSEVDPRATLRVQSLFDWFQDCGCEHAAILGISAADLLESDHTWVLLKYHVEVLRPPVWNEEVEVTSWRAPLNDLYDLRLFCVKDAKGHEIIRGNSAWVIMDFITRKPVRLSRCLDSEKRGGMGSIPDTFERIPPVKNPRYITDFRVRVSDLDFNRHVNNSIYIGWALEALPEAFLDSHHPRAIEVRFVHEISRGKAILSEAQFSDENPLKSVHKISGKAGEGELMRVAVTWEKNAPSQKPLSL